MSVTVGWLNCWYENSAKWLLSYLSVSNFGFLLDISVFDASGFADTPPSTANKKDINRKIQLKICQSLYTTDAQGAIFAIFITFENFDNVDTFNEHWDLKKNCGIPRKIFWDHTKTYSVCNRDAGTSKKYKFWGFLQSLGFDKTFIVGLCCCIWAITSQQNVFYTVWPPPKR